MRCPNCGSEVDEGALTCPHCQIDLSLTQRIPVTQAHWCPHCGALVPAAAESCPKCGLPLPQAVPAARPARAIRPTRNIKLPETQSMMHPLLSQQIPLFCNKCQPTTLTQTLPARLPR